MIRREREKDRSAEYILNVDIETETNTVDKAV